MVHRIILFAQIVAILLAAGLLILSIYKRQAPKSFYLSFVALSIFLYTVGYYLEITAPGLEAAIVATKVQYLGIPFITPLLLLFFSDFSGSPFTAGQAIALMAFPAVTCSAVLLLTGSGMYYSEIIFLAEAKIPHLVVTGTPFYLCSFAYTYLVMAAAFIKAIRFYRRGDAAMRRQTAIFLVGTAVPSVGNVLSLFFELSLYDLDITPLLMSGTSLLLGYSFLKLGLFQIAPVAREKIVETMNDAFILADAQGRFIDANSAALRLFPQLSATGAGTKMEEVSGVPWDRQSRGLEPEFSLPGPKGEARYFRASESAIEYKNKSICNCIMIYDITQSKQLLDAVSEMASRDMLTGLLNRGAFFEAAGRALQAAEQNGDASMLMIDLDHFKRINDTFGHLMGDEVLRTVSGKLAERFRKTDLFARYGGEELCAFLTQASLGDTVSIAEELRRAAERQEYHCDGKTFRVTISIGVCLYSSKRHKSLEALLADADAALYEAKKAGRNRVSIAGEWGAQAL